MHISSPPIYKSLSPHIKQASVKEGLIVPRVNKLVRVIV